MELLHIEPSAEGIARYIFEIFDIENHYVLQKCHIETSIACSMMSAVAAAAMAATT